MILLKVALLLGHLDLCLTYFLVAEFYFECLKFDFLGQRVILTVVGHLVELPLVAFHTGLRILNFATLLHHRALEVADVGLDFLDAGGETGYFVFQVLYFKGQFASQRALLIDSRQGGLKLEKRLQLLLHRQICRVFLCHNLINR